MTIGAMKERVKQIYGILLREYPDAHCTLDVISPEFFLLSNILSPQCTDRVANSVALKLYDKYDSVDNVSTADIDSIRNIVQSCGLHNVKSKNIKESAQLMTNKYNSTLPDTMEKLMEFPGIGRKTALVILHEIYKKNEGIVVDTHNIRIANRIGITVSKDPIKVEKDLTKVVPEDGWRMWSHLMVAHGRSKCVAQNPKCEQCPIRELCEYGLNLK
ncbi:MAG: endonuclease III [bacterium]